jgi:phenylacetate-CoA ligase
MRGDLVVPIRQSTPVFWRHNKTDNMLIMSSYHLGDSTFSSYLAALETFDPVLIEAYPSSIGILAAYMTAQNAYYKGESLKAIITSSETLDPRVREQIENRFGCKVFDWYGSYERVAAIGTCEKGHYHLISDYSYAELIPWGDNKAEIVGSRFTNWLMPLLRYKTDDVVTLTDSDETCPCGRTFPRVESIDGREADYIRTPDGRRIGRVGQIFKDVSNLQEAQIVQDRLDEIQIRVLPFKGFGKAQEARLIANAKKRLGTGISVKVEVVSSIPRTKNGKLRTVVCTLRD